MAMVDPFFPPGKVLDEVRRALKAAEADRVPVIIGLTDDANRRLAHGDPLKELLPELAGDDEGDVVSTDYFVRATVGPAAIARLDANTYVHRVWHDKPIKGMWQEVDQTVKARPARQLFGATGDEVNWAVLDSGIRDTHEYFARDTQPRYRVVRDTAYNFASGSYEDRWGHGTHVAGVIRKLAPNCGLYDFRVLDDGGNGSSFLLVQAMSKIRELNRVAGRLVIHGANLSLGGPVPVGSYGVGQSPECQEANRLVDSGVLLCVAAGNEGYKELVIPQDGQNGSFRAFMDISISDPGNAENVITVGSAHKSRPRTYGPSYFSSRGPTGDGRFKPDLVAPGEKVISAGHADDHAELPMSGTSMATPVVSAVLALFLSAHPEFRGRPVDVKRFLLQTCTDLGRDRYFQGAGMVDALRMFQAV